MSHYKPYPAYKDSGVAWLGRVPEHWQLMPLKRLVRSIEQGWSPECEARPAESGEWGVVKVGCVNGGRFRPEENKALPVSLEPRPELGLCKGDVLVSRANTRELVGSCAVVPQDYPNLLLCDKIYRIRAGEWVMPKFLAALITVHGRRAVEIEATGASSSMLNISQSVILDLPVALPEPAEQDQIMAAASHETARIDALVAKKTRFIELLREKRQALITHAVTKGIDPNVRMKDSGVEWLGEVPEHWGVKQLKHVVDSNSSITYGIVQAGPEYEGGVPYIRTSDMSGDELPVSGYPLTSPEIDESYARSRVRPGDIVMSIRASVGKCLPVPDGLSVANLTQGTAKVSPGARITRDYLLAYLNSGAAQVYFDLMAKGATFREITLDALRRTPVLLPPGNEQADIDQFIARHVARLDGLVQLSERSIVMLKERRSALITAAVTGQIDLREAV